MTRHAVFDLNALRQGRGKMRYLLSKNRTEAEYGEERDENNNDDRWHSTQTPPAEQANRWRENKRE